MTTLITPRIVYVNEDVGGYSLTFTLDAASAQTVTVNYVLSQGTAGTSDFSSVSGTLNFAPGVTAQTVNLVITNDGVNERAESLFVVLSGAVNATVPVPRVAIVIGASDNAAPELPRVSVDEVRLDEWDRVAMFRVYLNQASNTPVTVNYATSAGTALAGDDFTAASGVLSFGPGETEKTVSVAVTNDTTEEGWEYLLLSLGEPSGADPGRMSAQAWIAPSDAPAVSNPVLQAVPSRVNETSPVAFVDFMLSAPSTSTVSVGFTVTTANGLTASPSTDFVSPGSGTLNFAPGQQWIRLPVGIRQDAASEPAESTVIRLNNATGGVLIGNPIVPLTLAAHSALTSSPVVNLETTGRADENRQAAFYVANLSNPSAVPLTVGYRTIAVSALAGSDFVPMTGSLTFLPGETSLPLIIPLINDSLAEGDEIFAVELYGFGSGDPDMFGQVLLPTVIGANDGPPSGSPFTTFGPGVFDPTFGIVHVQGSLSAPSPTNTAITVNVFPSGPAFGEVYAPGSFTLQVPPGQQYFNLDLPTHGSVGAEQAKTFLVETSGLTTNSLVGEVMAARGLYIPTAGGRGAIRVSVASVTEGQTMVFEVSYVGPELADTLIVDYAFGPGTTANLLDGQHYFFDSFGSLATAGTFVFAPGGSNVKSLQFFTTDDDELEPTERVEFVFTVPPSIDGPGSVSGSIFDNDRVLPNPSYASVLPTLAFAGDGVVRIPIILSWASMLPVTVPWSTQPYPGSEFAAYTGLSGQVTLQPGTRVDYIDVPLDVDTGAVGWRGFQVDLGVATNAIAGNSVAVVNIQPQGAVPGDIYVGVSDVEVFNTHVTIGTGELANTEARHHGVFTMRLSQVSDRPVRVHVTYSGGQYSGPPIQDTVTFLPGQTERSVDIYLDARDEPPTLTLTGAEGATILQPVATAHWVPTSQAPLAPPGSSGSAAPSTVLLAALGTDGPGPQLLADAPATGEVVVSLFSEGIDESRGYVDVRMLLSAPRTTDVWVSYTTAAGATTSTSDFGAANAGTVHFVPGQTAQVLRFAILDDAIAEGSESFQVRITASTGLKVGNSAATVLIAANDGGLTGTPVLSIASVTVDETHTVARFVARLDRTSSAPVTFDFATADGTASAGLDFVARSGSTGFLPGETLLEIDVALRNDLLAEGDEAFSLLISNLRGAVAANVTAPALIVANDAAVVATPSLSVQPASAFEDDGFVDVVVRLSAPSAAAVSVNYSDTPASAGGGDYVSGYTGSLTFAPGETVKVVRIGLVDDAAAEATETFSLTLASPVNATIATATATVSILDIDGGPTVTVADNATGLNTGGDVSFTITFSEAVTGFVESDLAVTQGTVKSFAGTGAAYTVVVTPSGGLEGSLGLAVPANVATNAGGRGNHGGGGEQAMDTRGPTATSFSPAAGATGVALDTNIVLGLHEPASFGSGAIVLRTQAGATLQSFDVAAPGGLLTLSGDGLTLTIDPSVLLEPGIVYELVLGAGTLRDALNNANGLQQGYTFTTRANVVPVAANGSLTTAEDTPFAGQLPAASDADGQAITYAAASPAPAKGSVIVNANGSYTYTPAANANGSDSFGFSVTDTSGGSTSYGVSVSITPVNDVPAAAAGSFIGTEDTRFDGRLPVATDVDGDAIIYSAAAAPMPGKGSVTINADGSFSYTPQADANGGDGFGYTVSDGQGGSASYTMLVNLNAVNDAPTAANTALATTEDSATSGTLPAAQDVDGDTVSYAAAGPAPAKGSVIVNANGSYTYTPAANANGIDSFGFSVSDGLGGSSGYTVNVSIAPVNDAPMATDRSDSVDEDGLLQAQLPGSDVDGDTLTWSRASGAAHGTVEVEANGRYTYRPQADFNGSDGFSYTVSDGQGGSVTRQVVLSVAMVNDAPVGGVSLSGRAEVFETLAVVSSVTDADGLGSFSFQWLRDGSSITGATSSSYQLAHEDVGHAISVRVTYVDGGGSTETLTSATSAPVAGVTVVRGTAGRDTLAGTALRDDIAAGAGDDVVLASPGNDTISGDEGLDIMSWVGTAAAVTADLHSGLATPAGDAPDILIMIEALFGGSGTDHFIGLDQAPNLRGETLRGGGGNDTLDGGGGVDTAEYAFARAGYSVTRNLATGEITVTDTDLSNGDDGSDTLRGIERVQFADQMLAFGSRAEEIVRVAFVLWSPAIVTSSTLFSRGFSFYDVGYSFQLVSQAALQFWTDKSDAQLAAQLVANSGMGRSPEQLLALAVAAGGGDAGRAAMVREAALDAATTALLEASQVREAGVVSANEVPDFGALFGLLPG